MLFIAAHQLLQTKLDPFDSGIFFAVLYRSESVSLISKKKKDWIEQPIVLAPTKLKPAAPSCWDGFCSKAYYMPLVK